MKCYVHNKFISYIVNRYKDSFHLTSLSFKSVQSIEYVYPLYASDEVEVTFIQIRPLFADAKITPFSATALNDLRATNGPDFKDFCLHSLSTDLDDQDIK